MLVTWSRYKQVKWNLINSISLWNNINFMKILIEPKQPLSLKRTNKRPIKSTLMNSAEFSMILQKSDSHGRRIDLWLSSSMSEMKCFQSHFMNDRTSLSMLWMILRHRKYRIWSKNISERWSSSLTPSQRNSMLMAKWLELLTSLRWLSF